MSKTYINLSNDYDPPPNAIGPWLAPGVLVKEGRVATMHDTPSKAPPRASKCRLYFVLLSAPPVTDRSNSIEKRPRCNYVF